MTQAERMANEAVYVLQLSTRDAQNYVERNARVNDEAAVAAVKKTLEWARSVK